LEFGFMPVNEHCLYQVILFHFMGIVRFDNNLTRLSHRYHFEKPNDARALRLMNAAAMEVMRELPDIAIAYGASDEFSFAFHRNCQLFERRTSKLVSIIVSTFTAYYVHKWSTFFPSVPLEPGFLPTFDGRAVQYPSVRNLRDYMSWRQVDCHINNLYNTTFWAMIQRGGMNNADAETELQGTVASDKNEILFSRYGINYNSEPEMFRKGSVVFREYELEPTTRPKGNGTRGKEEESESEEAGEPVQLSKTQLAKGRKTQKRAPVVVKHVDIIKDEFWEQRPWLMSNKPGKLPSDN